MKKFVKYTALTALVLTVLGIVLLTIGAIGGSVQGIKTLDVLADKIKAGEFSIDAEDMERLEELLDTTGTTVEFIYEISSKLLSKVERENTGITNGIYALGGVEYVNIVMQNDEVSN